MTQSDSSSSRGSDTGSGSSDPQELLSDSGVALVCVTSSGDFDGVRAWSDSVVKVLFRDLAFDFFNDAIQKKLSAEGYLPALLNAHYTKKTQYSVAELGIPGLRHFIYKSRTQSQVTLPIFDDPYDKSQARKRCV